MDKQVLDSPRFVHGAGALAGLAGTSAGTATGSDVGALDSVASFYNLTGSFEAYEERKAGN